MTFTKVVFPLYCKPTRVSSISSFQKRDLNQSKIRLISANILYGIGRNPVPLVEMYKSFTQKIHRSLALTCSHLHSNTTSVPSDPKVCTTLVSVWRWLTNNALLFSLIYLSQDAAPEFYFRKNDISRLPNELIIDASCSLVNRSWQSVRSVVRALTCSRRRCSASQPSYYVHTI